MKTKWMMMAILWAMVGIPANAAVIEVPEECKGQFTEQSKDADAIVVAELRKVLDKTIGIYKIKIVLKGSVAPEEEVLIEDTGLWSGMNGFFKPEDSHYTLLMALTLSPNGGEHEKKLHDFFKEIPKTTKVYVSSYCKGIRVLEKPVKGQLDDIINFTLGGKND